MKKRVDKNKKWGYIVLIFQAIITLSLGIIFYSFSDIIDTFKITGPILIAAALLEIIFTCIELRSENVI